jgi:cyclic pyranopterin phosphate synthase
VVKKKILSHLNRQNQPAMVDISSKPDSLRIARAKGFIKLHADTIRLITQNKIKKGNVLITAQLAGIMAAKTTAHVISLCHNINLTKVDVEAKIVAGGVCVESVVTCIGKTGVEMEALHAVSIALLTIYDMCKAVDKKMIIKDIRLLEKTKMSA